MVRLQRSRTTCS